MADGDAPGVDAGLDNVTSVLGSFASDAGFTQPGTSSHWPVVVFHCFPAGPRPHGRGIFAAPPAAAGTGATNSSSHWPVVVFHCFPAGPRPRGRGIFATSPASAGTGATALLAPAAGAEVGIATPSEAEHTAFSGKFSARCGYHCFATASRARAHSSSSLKPLLDIYFPSPVSGNW